MKLKKARIVVEPLEHTNKRWASALKGKSRTKANQETISVSSWEILGKILSAPRLQILALIPSIKPRSISALAKSLERDFKNVYQDVQFLAELGLLELKEEGSRKNLIPTAKYDGIELGLVA